MMLFFYCLNCLLELTIINMNHIKNRDFRGVVMSSENTKIWQFNQYQKPDNTPSNIDADLESLIKKVDRCKNDPEKSSITKKLNIQCL